jgi:hypothetical protein
MLKPPMTALGTDVQPTVTFKQLNEFASLHVTPTSMRHNAPNEPRAVTT